MSSYLIQITETALQDITITHDYIAYELIAPETADKYARGIFDAINHLSEYGESIAISQNNFLIEQYGNNVRNINYKKMSIIYTIEHNRITVERIIAGALIK